MGYVLFVYFQIEWLSTFSCPVFEGYVAPVAKEQLDSPAAPAFEQLRVFNV
jgi:hypothetical protein